MLTNALDSSVSSRNTAYLLAIEGNNDSSSALSVEHGITYTIGRDPGTHFVLPESDHRASRSHARIEGTFGGVSVRDLCSSNGTYVNGCRVADALLRPGDRLRLGRTVLVLRSIDWVRARCPEMTSAPRIYADRPTLPLGPNDPRRLGEFELRRVIARGPRSIVYEAEARGAHQRIAVKRVLRRARTSKNHAEFFIRGQRTAIELRHPRIVRCLDAGEDPRCGELYVAMEFLPGGDCRRLTASSMELSRILSFGEDLFGALAYIHALGHVHGRVRPSNVLLGVERSEWCAKLGDFGTIDSGADETSDGFSADIHAAAATLYFLLRGRSIPPAVVDLLNRLVAIDPTARRALSAGEIAERLRVARCRRAEENI